MKRALAKRARSGDPAAGPPRSPRGPPQDAPSTPRAPRPKRPRGSGPDAAGSGNAAAYRARDEGRGRPRKSPAKAKEEEDDDDEDEGDDTRFYLRRQNAALAAELYAYRRRLHLLERERAHRRRGCRAAGRRLAALGGTWRGMEAALGAELARRGAPPPPPPLGGDSSEKASACTGLGTDVETVPALLHSLQSLVSNPQRIKSEEPLPQDPQYHVDDANAFENYSRGAGYAEALVKTEEDEDLAAERRQLQDAEDFAADLAARAAQLRDGVLGLLRATAGEGTASAPDVAAVPALTERAALLEAELAAAESRLEGMAAARNAATASERRVRRGLYRLAGGRLTVEEVLQAVEEEDGGTAAILDAEGPVVAAAPLGAVVSSSDAAPRSPASSAARSRGVEESPAPNGEEHAQLKKRLRDMQAVAETRDKKITELHSEREQQMKRINSLLLPADGSKGGPCNEAVRQSPLFVDALSKLRAAERRVKELEAGHGQVMEKWAAAKGDLELAHKTLKEMEEKHGRRWAELVAQFSGPDAAKSPSTGAASSNNGRSDAFGDARRAAELEAKLRQSTEAVRRTEALRAALADAYKMNEQLQSKLEDLRSKNAKMVAEKVAARGKSKETDTPSGEKSAPSPHGSSRRSSSGSTLSGDPSMKKLQQDYRRARKEVSAAVLSKDQAKLKQERAEKERDALMRTNARLLKQGTDKDDMNAKSLSTILHLKQQNEELTKKNSVLDQKAKAAQQLSLAARLAANAKNRVGEEVFKEKELLEKSIKKLQEDCQKLREERESVEAMLAQSKAKVTGIAAELAVARTRCDDLVAETIRTEDEKRKVVERCAVLKKESQESAAKAPAPVPSDQASAGFTVEQMSTQVKYLSGRINCPVCNVREKKCILLRCRHMFCQQCVDVNIKNRSRKCPACAQRFDTKDVAEIWL